MNTKRNIGTIALLGGSTAALAMLTGVAGARADDLKVNQQLLSDRLDQLAAVGLQPGAGAYLGVDQNKVAGAPVAAGSFPRSFLIPGTETSIKIYGQITEILDYWMSGGNPNATPQSTTVGNNGQVAAIPLRTNLAATGATANVASSRGNGIFLQSPRESKIGFETRTPTALCEARTVMEFDWAGSNAFSPGGADPTSVSDNLAPRLRYAYGTLGGFLAGQATSNFSDSDANQETLDFGGNVGNPGVVRIPQVRYTMPLGIGSFSVSAETPETDMAAPAGSFASDAGVIPVVTTSCTIATLNVATNCTSALVTTGRFALNPAKATAPDLTMAYYIPQPWGHFDISAVIRPGLDVQDGKFISRTFVGYGGHIGFDIKPGWFGWTRDDIAFHIVAGQGLGRYLNQSGNFALETNFTASQTSALLANNVIIHPTTEWGGNIGYQHWWTGNLRSNISYGINRNDIRSQLVGTPVAGVGQFAGSGANVLNKELMTAHVNLIWNPVSFIDVGVEYVWGQRQVVNNQSATENVLISKLNFKF